MLVHNASSVSKRALKGTGNESLTTEGWTSLPRKPGQDKPKVQIVALFQGIPSGGDHAKTGEPNFDMPTRNNARFSSEPPYWRTIQKAPLATPIEDS